MTDADYGAALDEGAGRLTSGEPDDLWPDDRADDTACVEPPDDLDELLEAALPCVGVDPTSGQRCRKVKGKGFHIPGCPAFYRPALRRHLAAWAAAKGAEAELLRQALESAQHRILEVTKGRVGHAGRPVYAPAVVDKEQWDRAAATVSSALARPRPSASGLLELVMEFRTAGDQAQTKADATTDPTVCAVNSEASECYQHAARRLATELGLEEVGPNPADPESEAMPDRVASSAASLPMTTDEGDNQWND